MIIFKKYQTSPLLFWSGLITFVVFTLLIIISCSDNSPQAKKNKVVEEGKLLAEKHCQSCHALPDPSILDANTWLSSVLPAMAPRLGIFEFGFQHYKSSIKDKSLPANFYPAKPQLSQPEWQKLMDYYGFSAPEELPQQKRSEPLQTRLELFDVIVPEDESESPAGTIMTKFHRENDKTELWTFDLVKQTLNKFDATLKKISGTTTKALITDLAFSNNEIVACNVNVINPNNARYGNLLKVFQVDSKLKVDTLKMVDSLSRPVQLIAADLNKDNRTDYIICEFGNLTGNLSWVEQKENGRFVRHVLSDLPGAITVHVDDYNNDGLPDICALFSQGDESIWLYTNDGKGNFNAKRILRFPPSYGSTWFELKDMNGDGNADIVYTCGDNADYSLVLKPYHGVYIYKNDGHFNFTQDYFFPINGCYKALARDYDQDGDIDIAAISFFADYAKQPDEGFVYLENKGSNNFSPRILNECRQGRWLTMDAGDIDGDGAIDLVLGNFSVRPSTTQPIVDWKKGAPFLILKNKGRSHQR